jgi:DNA-binding response OmpR family regulator
MTRILLVEDNPVDVRLLRYAFEQEGRWHPALTIADDGEKAINLLAATESTPEQPQFVILDLNLPKRDGTEVLQWIRSHDTLATLPVAIVSSSPMDVMRTKVDAARVCANCFFVKPMAVDEFVDLARELRTCFESGRAQQRG